MCIGLKARNMADSSSVIDFDDLIGGDDAGGGGAGRDRQELPEAADVTPPRRSSRSTAASAPPSKTLSRIVHSKWTWIAVGIVAGIAVGITIALIWFSQINKRAEAAAAAASGQVDVDKVNNEKKTAALVSTGCGGLVLAVTLIATKLTLKWK